MGKSIKRNQIMNENMSGFAKYDASLTLKMIKMGKKVKKFNRNRGK